MILLNLNRIFLLAFATSLVSLSTLSGLHSGYAAIDLEVTQNENVVVQAKLASHDVALRGYVFIVQIEDESGIVVFLDYKSGSIPPYLDQTESIHWRPGNDDIYKIKAFVWSDLESPTSLQLFLRELRINADEETEVLCNGFASCFTGIVTNIVDGDTLDVGDTRVRLSLVDTPEVGEAGYDEATEFTAELCLVGSKVLVDQDDGQPMDDFGRMIAKVTCEGDMMINAELLESGHAAVLTEYCAASEFSSESWIEQECNAEETPAPAPQMQDPIQEPPSEDPSEDEENCHPSYPDVFIPPPPPDLDCGDISYKNFRVVGSDPHRFDGNKDGLGCES